MKEPNPTWSLEGSGGSRLMSFLRMRDYYGPKVVRFKAPTDARLEVLAVLPGPCVVYGADGERVVIEKKQTMELNWEVDIGSEFNNYVLDDSTVFPPKSLTKADKTRECLRWYVGLYGGSGMHDPGCPEDDTCSCLKATQINECLR